MTSGDARPAERKPDRSLSHHILPSAATMIGICTTLIGLVKIIEARIGPSRVDEYAGLAAMVFLVSALASYLSLRSRIGRKASERLERAADVLFLVGLVALSGIAALFAYEAI